MIVKKLKTKAKTLDEYKHEIKKFIYIMLILQSILIILFAIDALVFNDLNYLQTYLVLSLFIIVMILALFKNYKNFEQKYYWVDQLSH